MRIIRNLLLAALGLLAAVGLLAATPASAQDTPVTTQPASPTTNTPVTTQPPSVDPCLGCNHDGGVTEDGSGVFAVVGRGGTIVTSGGSGGASCTYWPLDGGSPIDETGEAGGTTIDGVAHVLIGWDCDGDGLLDGQALVPLITPVDVARQAFQRVEDLLPPQDVVMMLDYGVSQSWTPLGVGTGENYFSFEPMSWEPVSATATIGGITATTTATPLRVEWDTGNLNGSTGDGDLRYWTCDGPGTRPTTRILKTPRAKPGT